MKITYQTKFGHTLTHETLVNKCKEIVAEVFAIESKTVNLETRFTDLSVDFVDALEISLEIEDEFDIIIPETEAEKFETVAGMVDAVASKLGIQNVEVGSQKDDDPVDEENYDLAIINTRGNRVNITRKAKPGEEGTDIVFSFDAADDLEDFIQQLRSAGREVFKGA